MAVAIFGALAWLGALVVNRLAVVLDPSGITVRRGFWTRSAQWQDIEGMYLPRVDRRHLVGAVAAVGGIPTFVGGNISGFTLSLRTRAGRWIRVLKELESNDVSAPPLAEEVRNRVITHVFPPLEEQYDLGLPVSFGKVSIRRYGELVFGRRTIPFEDLPNYQLIAEKGRLVLSSGKRGRFDASIRWDRIPNLDLLGSLFQRSQDEARTYR